MAGECIPYFRHGDLVTVLATVAITGKTFVELDPTAGVDPTTQLFQCQLPSNGGTVIGVAGLNVPLGGQVPIYRGKSMLVPVTAGETITASQYLQTNEFGQVVPLMSASLSAPTLTKGSTGSSGGTFAAGEQFWVATAVAGNEESLPSNEISATLVADGDQAMSVGSVSGASSYNWYRGESGGGESVLVANTTSTSFTDTGATGTPGYPPDSAAVAGVCVGRAWSSGIQGEDIAVALDFL